MKTVLTLFSFFTLAFLLSSCGTPIGVSSTMQASANISGSPRAGVFVLSRIELDFKGLPSKTFKKGDAITAKATIHYQGAGVLQAQWLLDGRVVEQLNVMLNRGSRLVLKPKESLLATSISGRHVLSLKVIQPLVAFNSPKLTFFITP